MEAVAYLIGAGSMSLGAERAGCRINAVWETPGYAKNAQTWNLNRPELPIEVLELDPAGYIPGADGADLIYGNPPCGGLSSLTLSRITSPTNNCMRQWIRMVVRARPRNIIMENAYQLATDRINPLLQELKDVLAAAGYFPWTWRFYSYQLGTSMIRQRMFLCATLDDVRRPELLGLGDLPGKKDCLRRVDLSYFLGDLCGVAPSPDPVLSAERRWVTQHWYQDDSQLHLNKLIPQCWDRIKSGDGWYSPKDWAKTSESERARMGHRLWADCPREFGGMHSFRPHVINFGRPCPTFIHYNMVHPYDQRLLTMRELARLMGYPDHWQFHKLQANYIAQGIPVTNMRWCVERVSRLTEC